MTPPPFDNLYRHGFVRVAAATPRVAIANPEANGRSALEAWARAHEQNAALVVFPELSLSGYSIDDLLQQDALLDAVESEIGRLASAGRDLRPLAIVGAPLRVLGRLYNCGVVLHGGRILGVVPKTFLPNYREYYECRHFASGAHATATHARIAGVEAPFGVDLLFAASDVRDFILHVEICEDLWTPIPPSSRAALSGATVLANLSASNATIAKSEYRHALCLAHSGRCAAAYVYSAAGVGESTTDLAWDGHALVYENGVLLAENQRFASTGAELYADVDLERLRQERLRQNTFEACAVREGCSEDSFRKISFDLAPVLDTPAPLRRNVDRFPFVPNDAARLAEHCHDAYEIQVQGLAQRLRTSGVSKIVIGVSGGLDSTQALLVAARAMDAMDLPRTHVLAFTLPAFGTTEKTRSNAWRLMRALGVAATELDVTAACRQMLVDIGHPFANGSPQYDITFENVQAGARTSLLFRLANQNNALVLGTGDLSELGLGWCTYGVGDQMSHYNVNASISKTLIQHLIRWVADSRLFGDDASAVLNEISGTDISPELIPATHDAPLQRTEDVVGPYELQDFNLFYVTRFGFRPSKIAFLAHSAWRDASAGRWPPGFRLSDKHAYDLATIEKWLQVFLRRFFGSSQFKRSAMPNGPKVSTGSSLSPRGDWRAPSDSSAAVWLAELDASKQT